MPDQRSPESIDPIKAEVSVPLPYGTLGHYRVNHRCNVIALQAANSRLFSFRNSHATNLLVLTRIVIKWLQVAAHTAAIEDSLDVFRVTGFSVSDTVNTVTPAPSVRRSVGMAAAPGAAEIRGVTIAGAAAGMTGGTLTKDGGAFAQLPQWFQAAMPTNQVISERKETELDAFNAHPFVFVQNEGFEIENRVLLGAAAGSSVYIDVAWAEVPAGSY